MIHAAGSCFMEQDPIDLAWAFFRSYPSPDDNNDPCELDCVEALDQFCDDNDYSDKTWGDALRALDDILIFGKPQGAKA